MGPRSRAGSGVGDHTANPLLGRVLRGSARECGVCYIMLTLCCAMLNYVNSILHHVESMLNYVKYILHYAESMLNYVKSILTYADSMLNYVNSILNSVESILDYVELC